MWSRTMRRFGHARECDEHHGGAGCGDHHRRIRDGHHQNDDTALLSISAPTITETGCDQTVNFTVTLDKAVEGGFQVAFSHALEPRRAATIR